MTSVLRGVSVMLATLFFSAGCASAPSSAPSEPTPAATAPSAPEISTPTPTPTPEPVASGIHVTASELSIVMSDGSIRSRLSYFEPVDAVVRELTEAFGAPPVVSVREAAVEVPSRTEYDWEGAQLRDWDTAAGTFSEDWQVVVTQPVVHGLEISTIDAVQAGDSALELEAAYPDLSWRATPTGHPERIDVLLGGTPVEATEDEWATSGMPRTGDHFKGYDGPTELAFAVILSAAAPDWSVDFFAAPVLNFGP